LTAFTHKPVDQG